MPFLLILLAGATWSAEADRLWLKGNYREALEQFGAMAGTDPLAAALGKARCLKSEGKYDEALAELSGAIVKKPADARLHAARAELLAIQGKNKDAAAAAAKAMEHDPKNLLARLVRAELLGDAGDFEKANAERKWFIDHYNEAQPSDPERLVLIAQAAIKYSVQNKRHDELDFILNDMLGDALKADADYWPAKWLSG
ncbi:MAG TPA: tetratricopeptide repeat protein, partial [Planctomycetia bacterium]|nr:tetratricopeptide repeat protein [Planctomycetia bacterium]